jgi:ABC-type multidrug transport system ATPase subunit
MLDPDDRPPNVNANSVRSVVRDTVKNHLSGVQLRAQGRSGSGGGQAGGLAMLQGSTSSRVIISGPDARELTLLASEIKEKAESIPEIDLATILSQTGRDEIRVTPDGVSLSAFGLTADQVLPALNVVSREGVRMRTGFTLYDGREIPMTVRRETSDARAGEELRRLRLATPAGVLPLSAIADVRKMPPPPTIVHKNGRREIEVSYRLNSNAPASGPARAGLEEEIREAIQAVHRPPGYTVETPRDDDGTDWFRTILVPVILLLFAVLALTFESVTMPLLVLVSLPLTLLGAIWALILAGMTAQPMVLMGLLALIGLTVNPAILLVDRMQQRARNGTTAGAAALAAVRERARPVLMTATTTIAGLWPLALVTGRENEIWPPFATVVMGGLITSTALTLLVIPVGFVFLHRLDTIFGRLGPWILIGWFGATTAVMAPLITQEVIDSMFWQIVTTLVVASAMLGAAVLIFRRRELPVPQGPVDAEGVEGPPPVDVRYLRKTYDLPGPIGRAWRVQDRFAERVLRAGGKVFDPRGARARIVPLLLVLPGALYLAFSVRTAFWTIGYLFVSGMLLAALARQVRRARGLTDDHGRVSPGGVEGVIAALAPWAALAWVVLPMHVIPRLEGAREDVRLWVPIALGLLLLLVQSGRHTAVRLARGEIKDRLSEGRLRRLRSLWRRFSRAVFGLDLPRKPVQAVTGVAFTVERGMVGILGPNGAGKTTLLRMLAGILDPTLGTVTIGGVRLKKLRRYLARYMGYLPQDFGLPEDLTAREYLEYYALLYELRPAAARQTRIETLLKEVGLAERADEKIGGFSGGMRQRVAVARTLLRLPPIIIVDEPTVGLDPRERIRFRNLLARLSEGRIVLFSTHVVEDVEVACERVIVMARGSVVFDGPPPELAHAAQGKVWTANLDHPDNMPDGVMLVDQVPLASGASRCRMLSREQPHPEATPTAPSLEDGYLWLVGVGGH